MRRLLIVIAALMLLAAALTARGRKGPSWEDSARQRKAEYIFQEALNAGLEDRNADAFTLLRYARDLSPADLDIRNQLAGYTLQMLYDDSASVEQGLADMRAFVDANPADLYNALRLARILDFFGRKDESLRIFDSLHRRFPGETALTRSYAEALRAGGGRENLLRAAAVYDTLDMVEGPDSEFAIARINIYHALGDTAALLSEGRRFRDLAPASPDNNILLADVFSVLERNDSALKYYNAACELDTANARAFYARAAFYNHTGDSVAFDREIFRVLKMEDLDVATKTEIMREYVGSLYADSLQRPRILDLVEKMVELHPLVPEFHSFYSSYLSAIDRFSEAADEAQIALDLDPSAQEKWGLLIALLSRAGRDDDALEANRRALEYYPGSPELHYLMSMNLLNAGEALQDGPFRELMKADSLMDDGYENYNLRSAVKCALGDACLSAGDTDKAFDFYEEAIRVNPYNAGALNNYAYALACEGRDLDKARRMIEEAIDMAEDDEVGSWLDTYAWVLYKQGRYEEARLQMEKSLALYDEPSEELYEHAAAIYEALGLHDKAREYRLLLEELKDVEEEEAKE